MPRCSAPATPRCSSRSQPSAYWGDEKIWDTHINNHNSMIDGKGRMWLAAAVRDMQNPGVLQEGLGPSVRQDVPARRQPSRSSPMLDPKTMKYTFVDTCFTTHHLNFA